MEPSVCAPAPLSFFLLSPLLLCVCVSMYSKESQKSNEIRRLRVMAERIYNTSQLFTYLARLLQHHGYSEYMTSFKSSHDCFQIICHGENFQVKRKNDLLAVPISTIVNTILKLNLVKTDISLTHVTHVTRSHERTDSAYS